MFKVVVFKFFMGEFTVRYGYKKSKGFPVVYTCEREAKEDEIKEYPNRINVGKEGEIHNNFIWYEWNGTDEGEKLCKLEALKLFKARENMLLHKAEKEICTRIEHEEYLKNTIENEIKAHAEKLKEKLI